MEKSENESDSSGDYMDTTENPVSESDSGEDYADATDKAFTYSDEMYGITVDKIQKHMELLQDILQDTKFGILDKLLASKGLTHQETTAIQNCSRNPYERSKKLIDVVLEKNVVSEFVKALNDTDQKHLVNYLRGDGVYNAEFGEDWPLGDDRIEHLNVNQEHLIDIIDPSDLIHILCSARVLNQRQFSVISKKRDSIEANEALLNIIRQQSISDYNSTISCLILSGQPHIAEILRKSGVIQRVRASQEGDPGTVSRIDGTISDQIAKLIKGLSIEERQREFQLAEIKLLAAKKGKSIYLYVYCETLEELTELHNLLVTGAMKTIVETLFNKLVSRQDRIVVSYTYSEEEYVKCKSYFEKIGSKHSESLSAPEGVGAKSELEGSFNEDDGTATSKTVMNHLPLELLDMILRKVYRNSCVIGNLWGQSTDEEIVLSLASVDNCWFQRIIRRRFKNKIWRNLTGFYKKFCKRVVVCRNTRLYVVESIQTKGMLKQLRSADCLTDIQTRLVNRGEDTRLVNKGKDTNRRLNGNKEELVHLAKSLDDSRYSTFVQCLYDNKQNLCARVASNGGVVVKAEIQSLNLENRKSVEQQMVKKLKYLRDRSKPKSPTLERQLKRLKAEGNEILDSLLDRNPVVWLWCHTESGLSKLQADFDLVLKLFNLETNTRPSEIVKVKTVNIDSDRFRKEVVETLQNALNNVAMPKIKQVLAERMNPDFGILDKLLVYKAFSKAEIIEVRTLSTSHKRNSRLIELATENEELINLFHALKDTRQEHLVNYVTSEGEYSQEYGGAWPLTERETSILDVNQESLVDFLDFTGDEIISKLYEVKVLNRRQTEFICKQPYDYDKAAVLLDFLYRSSLSDYWKMITCLRLTNQKLPANILLEGATAAVRVHNALDGETQSATAVENETVTRSENILSSMNLGVEIKKNTLDNVAIPEINKMLVERIFADFGILDKLLASKALSRTEIAEVKQLSSSQLKNSRLLELATKNEKRTELFNALKDTHQEHLVNYVTSEGEYSQEYGGAWPLSERETKILDVNHESLVELIDFTDIINALYMTKVLNWRQKEFICKNPSDYDKAAVLLDFLYRSSLSDYWNVITCLRLTNQQHVARILLDGGERMATSPHESDRGEEPMEMIENPEVEGDAFRSSLERHREFLEERIDPDFGLLDRLRSNKGITYRQNQEISVEKVPFRKSRMILDYILQGTGSDKITKFREALRETKQEHLVNFVHGDGEYMPQFGGNWPLGEAKVEILDDNSTFLTENIDSAYGLLTFMIQKKAITQRQMESISVQQEPCKRNEALLDIIRRGSQSEFEGTIEALKVTNQESIADVLILGGMVLSVHSKADSNLPEIGPAEEEIVDQIDEILPNKTLEETRHLLETYISLKNSGLILAKRKRSIVFFFHCKNIEQLRLLLELLITDEIQKTIEMIYNRVLSTSSIVRVKVTWNDAEYNKAERKLQEIEPELPVVESKAESTSMEVEVAQVVEPEAQIPEATVEAAVTTKLAFAGFVEPQQEPMQREIDINAAILRNNTDFLNQHIRPRGVIDKLHAAEILSDEDTRYIKTLRHVSEKNDEMLNVIRNASSEHYNMFVSYLRESGQTLVADVAEKGGVVMKLKVTHEPTVNLEEVEKAIVEKLNQLQDTTIPKSEEVWRFLSQLKRANIEIVSSRLDKGVVMWCWCHSQSGLKKLDDISMSDTKQPNLLNGLFGLLLAGKNAPTISSVYLENPEKDVVCRKHKSIAAETKFPTGERQAFGVAILRTKICLLYRSPNAVVVYEEGDLAKPSEDEMSLDGIVTPIDIAYSKESNCLYITDEGKASVWKIAISSPENKVDLWLDGGVGDPFTLSVTSDGRVVMVKRGSPSSLDIYHPDARLLLHLILPAPILIPNHAVESSKGNLIVSYTKDAGAQGGVCEITKEGQIISRFDSMFESINGLAESVNTLLVHIAKPRVYDFNYLATDENDQVYACDNENNELAIFDSRLVLLEGGKSGLIAPHRVQYFKEKTQLVIIHGVEKNLVSVLPMK